MCLSPPTEDDAFLSLSLVLLSSSRAARLGAHKSSVFWQRALVVCSKNEGENFKMGREEGEEEDKRESADVTKRSLVLKHLLQSRPRGDANTFPFQIIPVIWELTFTL